MRFSIMILAMCSVTCDASSDMQAINGFLIDRTEISIAEFQRFASATEFISQAERAGGGRGVRLGLGAKPRVDLENSIWCRVRYSFACSPPDI